MALRVYENDKATEKSLMDKNKHYNFDASVITDHFKKSDDIKQEVKKSIFQVEKRDGDVFVYDWNLTLNVEKSVNEYNTLLEQADHLNKSFEEDDSRILYNSAIELSKSIESTRHLNNSVEAREILKSDIRKAIYVEGINEAKFITVLKSKFLIGNNEASNIYNFVKSSEEELEFLKSSYLQPKNGEWINKSQDNKSKMTETQKASQIFGMQRNATNGNPLNLFKNLNNDELKEAFSGLKPINNINNDEQENQENS